MLHLRDEASEFLNAYRLRSIINKYSDHISMPIIMDKKVEGEGEGEDKTEDTIVDETVNSATALWTRGKKDISDDEYEAFYKHVGHDYEAPLARVHNKVEGKLEYTSLLYIPARAPFDLWDREKRHGIKLYVRRVFIMDDAEQLIPSYLRFVKGIVDSDDLPLNISREILQRNKTIDAIRSGCTKKILDLLAKMAKNEADKYATFWKEFGKVLKEGIIEVTDKKEDLARLFRFSSTHDDNEEQTVSLEDYLARMKEGQKAIYYIVADSFSTAKNSPHLEIFRKKGIEVLLLNDPIDEWLTTHLSEFEGKALTSVNKGELDLDAAKEAETAEGEEKKPKKKRAKKGEKEFKDIVVRLKELLEDKVKDVRVSDRLTTSPACLVADENDMGRHLEQILAASGQSMPGSKPILEINPKHLILKRLKDEQDEDRFKDWSHIIFDQALLSEGGKLDDPAGFVHRLNNMFLELSKDKSTD